MILDNGVIIMRANMKVQNNAPNYLRLLLRYKLITLESYWLRSKANELKIKTYSL